LFGDTSLLEALNNVAEFLLGIGVHFTLAGRHRLAKGESRANDGCSLVVGSCRSSLSTAGFLCLMLLAQDVILKRILAVVCLLTDIAYTFEVSLVGFCTRDSPGLQDLFSEDIGGNGRQRSNSALEVISTVAWLACIVMVDRR
jgi:hypothetical protein